jgi:pantoate--beta-alanine ligase
VKIFTTVSQLREAPLRSPRILVPTMGALHRGHMELIRVARDKAANGGEVAVTIFVNPLQFEPGSDFERYPRLEERDEKLCRDGGVDILFRPPVSEMYADDRSIAVEETSLSEQLCGRSRPGHFRGVCTVVAKLFNILRPDIAVFGEEDFQQLAIIRRMVRDLNFPLEIVGVPTVRESDGLAMSSRNQYLNAEERAQATVIRRALLQAATDAKKGEDSAAKIVQPVRRTIEETPLARIDYVELVDSLTMQPVSEVHAGSLVAVAVFFGKTRLIDNILIL